jgi:hypothetical protein
MLFGKKSRKRLRAKLLGKKLGKKLNSVVSELNEPQRLARAIALLGKRKSKNVESALFGDGKLDVNETSRSKPKSKTSLSSPSILLASRLSSLGHSFLLNV